MKALKLILGIILIVTSSVYFMYCISIFSMAKTYGTEINTMILIIPFGFIILGIYLIVSASKDESEELKRYRQQEQQQRAALYPNRNYKAKNSEFYLMTPKQKLEYTYDRLPEKEQQKVLDYAESLMKMIENQKYEPKK